MREFLISENDANQRVDRFLNKACPLLPSSLMYKYIRNKKIKVNKKRCTISQRLAVKDSVQCYIKEEFFQSKEGAYDFTNVSDKLTVIYEDEHILVAYKPKNMLVQKDQSGIQDNMNDRLRHYLYVRHAYDPMHEHSFTPAFAHRLDRNTEGILIAGKTAAALRCLNEKIKTHEIEKYYLALAEGELKPKEADLIFYHNKDIRNNKAVLYREPSENTKQIHTHYRLIQTIGKNSLAEVQLFTGKSHQIRASFAMIHHPLIGDKKYGAKQADGFGNQALCAYKLRFAFKDDCCLSYLKDREIVLKSGELIEYIQKYGENQK